MLDSDAQNADARLNVQFYDGVQEETFASSQEGRRVTSDVCRVRIMIPGDSTLEIDRPATEEDKARFPTQYAFFLNSRNSDVQGGTPVEQLTWLSRSAVENLKSARFYTVEQVANGSDQNLQRLGMSVGMDPLALRERCIKYLSAAEDNAAFTKAQAALEQRDAQIAAMQGQIAQLTDVLAAMNEKLEKRGPGRPPKQEAEAA